MPQQDRFYDLAQKWLQGTLTEAEKKEFEDWYANDEAAPLSIPPAFAGTEEELRLRMWRNISKRKEEKAKVFWLRRYQRFKVAAAAAAILVCTVAFYYYLMPQKVQPPAPTADVHRDIKTVQPVILPGGNKAVLVLGDGSEVVLDTALPGTIAQEQNAKIVKLDDGQLAYSTVNGRATAVTYNTLTTPRGGQYAITLADGTRVWLNAASSLRFPTAFQGKERLVELSGEGYFEVAKNPSRTFKVKVGSMEVQVLGTHFNVMGYADEETTKTTLLEGAVRLRRQSATIVLQPGQQAQVREKGSIKIMHNINTEEAIAWKNGYFNFEGIPIETIMRQVARWYDIEVAYTDKINTRFYGSISRHAGIEKVFKMLELTGAVRFAVHGKKVVVRS